MTKCVIIVTYEPELNNLKRLIKCAEDAGFLPILVDNSEKYPVEKSNLLPQAHVISMNGNAGIAAAQNAGVLYAKKLQEMGAQNVLISMDKDGAILITKDKKILYSKAPKTILRTFMSVNVKSYTCTIKVD